MAVPTDVRVEALSISSTIIRWTSSGSNNNVIYRSTDGVTYTAVEGSSQLSTVTSYTDTGLATGTKYWYKISNDDGSTFSSVVTVYTMVCGADGHGTEVQATQTSNDTPTGDEFNDLANRVEEGLNVFRSADGQTCVACITDGSVVINCWDYAQCDQIDVPVDQDVNSVSMPNCDDGIKTINFIVPPNTTRKICGFPNALGFTGDECFQAPISGGATGTVISVGNRGGADPKSKTGVRGGGSGGGGAGGAACTCVPGTAGQLTIKSCNANNSLNCATTKSLTLIACGGRGPYTWSRTGSIKLSSTVNGIGGATSTGSRVYVTPPTNSGSGVAGNAYTRYYLFCQQSGSGAGVCAGVLFNLYTWRKYGCNDVATTSCTSNSVDSTGCAVSPTSPCKAGDCNNKCNSGNCSGLVAAFRGADEPCLHDATLNGGGTCDTRSAGMISNGCNPCGVQAGATVTVTDALGTQVTIVLKS